MGMGFQQSTTASSYHSKEELLLLKSHLRGGGLPLPNYSNPLFAGSGKCEGCHGYDPLQEAMVDDDGVDVNVVDDWRASMMANSAKDPFWRAKVSHESIVNPAHAPVFENLCTSCHAPLGHHSFRLAGVGPFTLAAMDTSALYRDGVSCNACHQQPADSLGVLFTGQIKIDMGKNLYGPYDNPFAGPMTAFVGFPVAYGPHINESELCASCHTLITETADLNGNLTGNHFFEQVTYHEWVNSDYNTNDISCQSCHAPQISDSIMISANYGNLAPRSPFGRHFFVGANAFMMKLMRDNIDTLKITAGVTDFDSTIARTNRMLQQESLDITLTETMRTSDTAFYEVELVNKAGHKLPSGYPSRRMFVEFVVLNDNADTLFKSGIIDGTYEVLGQNPTYEPHYQMINQEDQVQIYEMVMGDVNNDVTTVLERANAPIKDNRIPPTGFTTGHYAYDTTLIAGTALTDVDFNKVGATEGAGKDIVHYHVPLQGYSGDLHVSARVYYQTAPPKWMVEMFSVSSPRIDHFKEMYDNSDQSPTLMNAAFLGSLYSSTPEYQRHNFTLYPNPTSNGQVSIRNPDRKPVDQINVFSENGRLVKYFRGSSNITTTIVLPDAKGIYYIELKGKGLRVVKKVISL